MRTILVVSFIFLNSVLWALSFIPAPAEGNSAELYGSKNNNLEEDVDLKIIECTSLASTPCAVPPYSVSLKVTNIGTAPAPSFSAEIYGWDNWFYWNQYEYSVYQVFDSIYPGDTIVYTYPNPIITPYFDEIKCKIVQNDDINISNNSASISLDSYDGLSVNTDLLSFYGYVNDPHFNDTLFYAYAQRTYQFYINEPFTKVKVSLCGSSFDTQLTIFKCGEPYYLFYNDNYCGNQSQITMYNPEPSIYYAKVYGLSANYGNYTLSITGDYKQSILLPQGWSMFSTNLDVENDTTSFLLSAIVNKLIIAKDGNGNVYWPVYNVSGIDRIKLGSGYQCKMSQSATLDIYGSHINPANYPVILHPDWDIIGYLNNYSDSITTVMQNILPNLSIVKNDQGLVYWPQSQVNTIQIMYPGEGYQIKMIQADTLYYGNVFGE